MKAHTSERPDVELQEALRNLNILDNMVTSGAVNAHPWYANTRAFLEEMLEVCHTPLSDEDSDSEGEISAEEEGHEVEEEDETPTSSSDVDAHVAEEQV